MKKILTLITTIALSFSFTACESLFDNLEGDKTKLSGDFLAETEAGLSRMMAALYQSLPMGSFEGDQSTDNAVNITGTYMSNSVPSYWDYKTMRQVNNLIKIVEKSYEAGNISESLRDTYIGEARFVRAYYYFGSVRTLGGVPIITEPLDDKYDGGENAGLYIPRSTEKETWDFVLSELQAAADMLPKTRTDGTYRANKWAALALKSRVALYAASVSKYWENAKIETSYQAVAQELTYMKKEYAADYYKQCIDACEEIIKNGGFSLYNAEPTSLEDAITGLTDLFLTKKDEEWIFGKSYNDGTPSASNGFDWNNSPYQTRFDQATGVWKWGLYNINAELVDQFDCYDEQYNAVNGTLATRTDGKENEWQAQVYADSKNAEKIDYIPYKNLKAIFANKDARFQAWVIYPGVNFRGTDIIIQGGIWDDSGLKICDSNQDYVEAGGKKYYMYGDKSAENYSGFDQMGQANNCSWYSTGFGIRKYLDPAGAKQYSTNPYYDIRYTEVLLNYCEALVETNQKLDEAKKYLNAIRRRAYFQDQVEPTLANVLKERRVELAFESDRAMTLHRRRELYRPNHPNTSIEEARRRALIPVVDVRSGKAQYVFVRANMYADDTDKNASGYQTLPINYYGGISNYSVNKLVPNPSQE